MKVFRKFIILASLIGIFGLFGYQLSDAQNLQNIVIARQELYKNWHEIHAIENGQIAELHAIFDN